MAIVFSVVLIVAASLLFASNFIVYGFEDGFGIGVAIELLSQTAFFLVIITFFPRATNKGNSGSADSAMMSKTIGMMSGDTNSQMTQTLDIDD
jgi:hypothetical protein